MAAPNWDAAPPTGGWDGTPVDWAPDEPAPPEGGAPVEVTYYPQGPTRTEHFRFLLLDGFNNVIGTLHPNRDRPPRLTNRPTGAIKRRLSSFHLDPSDAAAVNPVTDRVMPQFVPSDGSTPWDLGVFLWSDAEYPRRSSGVELDSTLHDQGVILGQSIADAISFPTGHSIYDALFLVFSWAGFPNPDIDPIPGDGVFTAPQAWAVTESNTYYGVLAKIAQDQAGAFEPYFTRSGRPRIRIVGDLALIVPDIVYDGGLDGNIYRGEVVTANNLLSAPNRYVVVDTSAGGGIVAKYHVPADSPHSFERKGWYATRVIPVQGVTSAAAGLETAMAFARQDVDSYEDIYWSSPFDPRHDTLDVVRVLDDDYLETEWSAVLAPGGDMAHKGKKLRHAEVRVPGGAPGQGPPTPPPDEPPPPPPEEEGETILATYEAEDATLIEEAVTPGTGAWSINAAGRFVNPDGQVVRLLGANGSVDVSNGQPFIFNMPVPAADGGGRQTFTNHVADIQNWGWNYLRCVVLPSNGTYGANALQAVVDLVNACAAAKIVVNVYCLEAQSPTSSNNAPNTAPFNNIILPFIEDVLAECPDQPYLWFNPNGENREDSDYNAWKALNDYLYTAIRGFTGGGSNMLTFTSYNYGQSPLSVANWNTFASGKTNVAMDWHTYGAYGTPATYETGRQTLRAGNVPFLVGEFGYTITGDPLPGTTWENQRQVALQNVNSWYTTQGESVCIWIGTSDTSSESGYSMRNVSGGGGYLAYSQPLSEAGQAMWNARSLSKVIG